MNRKEGAETPEPEMSVSFTDSELRELLVQVATDLFYSTFAAQTKPYHRALNALGSFFDEEVAQQVCTKFVEKVERRNDTWRLTNPVPTA